MSLDIDFLHIILIPPCGRPLTSFSSIDINDKLKLIKSSHKLDTNDNSSGYSHVSCKSNNYAIHLVCYF